MNKSKGPIGCLVVLILFILSLMAIFLVAPDDSERKDQSVDPMVAYSIGWMWGKM